MNRQLIVFAGLPGSGKTTLARKLAKALPALLIRIDTIEQALISNGDPTMKVGPMGYVIAYRLASENLSLGASVVADCVNPVHATREAWREVAKSESAPIFEIEVICSNRLEHRERVETRTADIKDLRFKDLRLPTWEEVVSREYEPWSEEVLVIDTAKVSSDEAIEKILSSLQVG
jgi:predicted kinase